MRITFRAEAQEELDYFEENDKIKVKKICKLLENIKETPYSGIGKPEALKYELSGYWSRRIDSKNRLVYKVEVDEIMVIHCRYHYEK